ncbi:MAG: pilin [Patescibacteria group bacterium]
MIIKPISRLIASAERYVLYLLALGMLSVPTIALAETTETKKPSVGLNVTAEASGKTSGLLRTPGLGSLIGEIIGAVLGMVGVLFFILMIYAGFLWMTSRGNEEQVTKAKNIFSGAIIGLFIIVTAYYLVDFLFGLLEQSLTAESAADAPAAPKGE